jgi:hypothetical protein
MSTRAFEEEKIEAFGILIGLDEYTEYDGFQRSGKSFMRDHLHFPRDER